jgi:hypothetical protein
VEKEWHQHPSTARQRGLSIIIIEKHLTGNGSVCFANVTTGDGIFKNALHVPCSHSAVITWSNKAQK